MVGSTTEKCTRVKQKKRKQKKDGEKERQEFNR